MITKNHGLAGGMLDNTRLLELAIRRQLSSIEQAERNARLKFEPEAVAANETPGREKAKLN